MEQWVKYMALDSRLEGEKHNKPVVSDVISPPWDIYVWYIFPDGQRFPHYAFDLRSTTR